MRHVFCVSVVLAMGVAVAENGGAVFEVEWRTDATPALDLSFLLDAPAGREGFVTIRDGHLHTAGGRRLRIWGVNLTAGGCFPEKEDAPVLARRLAQLGINGVRFHFLDSNWGEGKSLFPRGGDTTRRLDPEQLDRLDFFVAELKKHGIYSNFNLNVGRNYRSGDDVAEHQFIGLAKAATLFDPRLIKLQREYAAQLLGHRNPYTGTEYRREPALVIVELVNENSLVEAWFSDRLVGDNTSTATSTWEGISPYYARQLDQRYNAWLAENLSASELAKVCVEAGVGEGQPIPRLRSEQFAEAGKKRFCAEAHFLMELERDFFVGMRDYLKDDLGVRALVVGTSDHNHYRSSYALLRSMAEMDVVDGHVYWQHPSTRRDPRTGRSTFTIENTPMVNDPGFSTVVQLSRSAVAGKPYTVSETNHPFPNEYACEGVPILAAYCLFHDWDGVFFYTLQHEDFAAWPSDLTGHFDLAPDPVKMAGIAACALMVHRGDVQPARRCIDRRYDETAIIEGIRALWRGKPYFTEGFEPLSALVHTTRIASFEQAQSEYPAAEVGSPLKTDTGELTWYTEREKGLVAIDTDRTQALIGFVRDANKELPHLAANVDNEFCSVILTSLDGRPLSQARRLLLTAVARTSTTAMKWDDDRTSLESWGRLPMRIDPVRGEVTLNSLASGQVTARPLDGAGRGLQAAIKLEKSGMDAKLPLGKPVTTAWLIEIAP